MKKWDNGLLDLWNYGLVERDRREDVAENGRRGKGKWNREHGERNYELEITNPVP